VLERIQRLAVRIPEAKTASLDVMLLQADYFRAEALMTRWAADRRSLEHREEAGRILARIAPQLDARQEQLRGAVEKLVEQLDGTSDAEEHAVKSQELNRMESVAGRAAFFAAWSNYYLGLSSQPLVSNHPGFLKARDIFRRILGMDGGYGDLEADSLGLESIWRSRTLIGLGMAEASSGNLAGSKSCFDLLERGPAPPEIHEMAAFWRLQSLANANLWSDALALAQQYIAAQTGAASQGRVSFAVSLIQTAFSGGITDPALAQQLGRLGVTGLIKLRQLGTLRQLVDKYQVPLEGQPGFYLLWFAGQQRLEKAEASRQEQDYAQAAESLAAALDAPDARSDMAAAAQCRYQLGWCQYQLSAFADAASSYAAARDGLKPTDRKLAGDAAWMAFVCYQSLAKTQRQYVGRAIQVLADLKREFPEHPHARHVDYYIGKLQQADLPREEMIEKFASVSRDSPDYPNARFEICLLLHEQWTSAAAAEKRGWREKLLAAADTFLEISGAGADAQRRLHVCALAADAAMNTDPADEAAAARYLDAARPLADAAVSAPAAAEYHYRRLQLATRRGEEASRRAHATWLVENAAGSRFEIPALVICANGLDAELSRDSPGEAALREGLHVYQRLVAHYGDAADALKSSRNAQVAASRLADYAERLQEFETADRLLSNLLQAFPTDAGYLRRAGLVAWRAGRFPAALQHWRTLATGLPKESDAWFEAKYYQLVCLAEVDVRQAREAMQQFRLLYPQLGPPDWRGRFAELQRRLDKSTG